MEPLTKQQKLAEEERRLQLQRRRRRVLARRRQDMLELSWYYLQTQEELLQESIAADQKAAAEEEPMERPRKAYTSRTFLWTLSTWSTGKFKRRMRMTKPCFQQLLVGFTKSASFMAAGCHESRRITPEVWLAAAIRDLAAGTTLDGISEALGIDESSYSDKREQLMQAIIDACVAAGQRPLGIPTSDEGWSELADTFSRSEYPEFDKGVRACLAGDGTLIGFSPYEKVDYYAKEKWRCRKGFLATNCVFYFDGYRR